MQASPRVLSMIDGIIEREGGFSDHPNDPGGATMYGITESVARVNGYHGDMRAMPREFAASVYLTQYFIGPKFNLVADQSPVIADELTDTGVNMGVVKAGEFLQTALNAFNLNGMFYRDLLVDGHVGNMTVAALRSFLEKRGAEGEGVLLKALNCLQCAEYLRLAKAKPEKFETFVYGWIKERIG